VAVGEPQFLTNQGRVQLFFGGPGTFDTFQDGYVFNPGTEQFFGRRVAAARDFNGDGFADLLVGALVLAAPRPDAASHLCQAAPSRLAQAVGVNCQGSRTLPRSAARMAACRYAAGSLQWSLSVSSTV